MNWVGAFNLLKYLTMKCTKSCQLHNMISFCDKKLNIEITASTNFQLKLNLNTFFIKP